MREQKTIVVLIDAKEYVSTNVTQSGETAVVTVPIRRLDDARGYRADVVMVPRTHIGVEAVRAMTLALTDDSKGNIITY